MRSRMVASALALGAAVGCRAPRMGADLGEPREWRSTDAAPVAVADGESLLPVVTADTPRDRWAALFLAKTVEETCGRRPDVWVEMPGQVFQGTAAFFVGDVSANRDWSCALTEESAEAFRVVAGDGCVRFLGRSDFAVFDWCERELGLRYYCAEGKCVEPRERIVARALDYSDRPAFECRLLGWRAPEPWVRVAKGGSVHRGGVNVHQPHRWFRSEPLLEVAPDIFETGETPMLCYGNPRTLDYYKWAIDRHIAGVWDFSDIVNTNRKVVTVSQWDAPIKCACEHCRGLYDRGRGGRGDASPIIWGRFLAGLAEWLAAAHPDYMISFLPYLNTCEVPRKGLGRLKDFGNAEAEVCTMPGLALLKDRRCRENEERILREWRDATGRKVLNWHYGCWPAEMTSAPYVFGRTIREHYANMREVSCGTSICGGAGDPRLALSMYVWMRCLWNPDLDVEAVYDGFARRMFGPAEKPMRELIALQESCWERPWVDEVCSHRNVFGTSFPRGDVERMKTLLAEARTLAVQAGDARAARRVEWYASGFEAFFAESDVLAARKGPRTIRPGETNEMADARSVWHPRPWAPTTVVTSVTEEGLRLTVRCAEPAAAKMDFTKAEDDFVNGHDCVTFAFDDAGEPRLAVVDLAGGVKGGWDGFAARVAHDEAGWTVEAHVRLSEKARAAGCVRGNVARWRVGDRRHPEKERVPGSRYEHSRLGTCFTRPDDDPAAFVIFSL